MVLRSFLSDPQIKERYFNELYSVQIVEDAVQPYSHTVPHILAAYLHQLQYIGFGFVDWTRNRLHSTFFIHIKRATSVTHLWLYHCQMPAFCDFQRIVSAMFSLVDIRLLQSGWQDTSAIAPRHLPRCPRFNLMIVPVYSPHVLAVVNWLLGNPSVQEFSIRQTSSAVYAPLRECEAAFRTQSQELGAQQAVNRELARPSLL
ncbi:hypothetical protein OBBRIDRAFT_837180 [Obba rivulosa]|uniref:Uncharacterized protein n=1 Tax=Obba rivulosa TaxID=1052685 RepID=A0A8E2ATJ0_9APHY|nr:hypothetical protein OBBRIDRAFT_837180 [Obba rivulosa]